MSRPNPIPREVDDALALFFDNQATPEVCQTIHNWLEEDPNNAAIFAEVATIERMIYATQKTEDASAIFALLKEAEEASPIILNNLNPAIPATPHATLDEKIALRKALVALGYAGRITLCRYAGQIVGMAAALLLATGLIMWIANLPTRPQLDAVDLATPSQAEPTPDVGAIAPPIVATISAQRDAVWDSPLAEGASAPGSQPQVGTALAAGQRLTLTQGFAEITTARGAIVTLEAPCTVEFTDSANAIRLHAGKLVGLCETESAKGFTVHAKDTLVIDVATEFAVAVHDTGEVDVHVLTGEVLVSSPSALVGANTFSLTQGQAVRVPAQPGEVVSMPARPERFARDLTDAQTDPALRYAAAIIADRPIAYYRFESIGPGGIVRNEMGDRYHGQVVDRVGLASAGLGKAAQFTGQGYIQIDQTISELAGAERYTIACWVRADRVHHGNLVKLEPRDDPSEATLAMLALTPAVTSEGEKPQSVRYLHRIPAGIEGGTNAFSSQSYIPGRWIYIVAVKDGSAMTLYLNGERSATADDPAALSDAAFITRIGINMPHADKAQVIRPLLGQIDELALYDRALTDRDIANHYLLATQELALIGMEK